MSSHVWNCGSPLIHRSTRKSEQPATKEQEHSAGCQAPNWKCTFPMLAMLVADWLAQVNGNAATAVAANMALVGRDPYAPL